VRDFSFVRQKTGPMAAPLKDPAYFARVIIHFAAAQSRLRSLRARARWRMSKFPAEGRAHRSAFILYSEDGKRAAEVLEFDNGEIYLDEQEWVEGTTFKNRHSGKLVGPFASPADAEKFIVATSWFRGGVTS
jgi:hypothetical protein